MNECLQQHLAVLAVPRHGVANPEGHARAAQYIGDSWRSFGLHVDAHDFSYQGQTFQNWRARTARTGFSSHPKLIIGAHFDTVPDCPGADDNASGVAVLLELSRWWAQQDQAHPKAVDIEFVAFDLEECDLIGSRAYVEDLKRSSQPVAGIVCLEMVGFRRPESGFQRYPHPFLSWVYPDRGDFIALVGSLASWRLTRQVRRAFKETPGLRSETLLVPGQGQWVPDVRRSDHASFWDAGFPGVLVTDTSFLRNPFYHGAQDTTGILDLEFMDQVLRGLQRLLQIL